MPRKFRNIPKPKSASSPLAAKAQAKFQQALAPDQKGQMDHAMVFDHIYTFNLWAAGSGHGSTEENTREYRWFLENFLKSNYIKSVLDIGCGDWQFSRHIDWTGIEYLGVDVSAVVLANTKTFTRPGIEFRELNAVTNPLPSADLLVAKDVLQHWSNADILGFLPKLMSFRMALITNGFHPTGMTSVNLDIKPGRWRPVDLRRPPFSLPGSYVYWFDGGEPKYVFLWSNPAGREQ
jgi:SAM-dependent methyltransferase